MNIDARAPAPVYGICLILRDIVDSKCFFGRMLWRFVARRPVWGQAILNRPSGYAFFSIRSPDLSLDLSLSKHGLFRKRADVQR